MTVFESLQAWISEILHNPANGFPGRYLIDAEFLPEKQGIWEPMAIMSNPNDTAVQMIGGQVRHTSFKTLYITRNFIDGEERVRNEAFLEKLTECIYRKNMQYDMPQDGRKWRGIEYTGGAYPSNITESTAIYQITLKIVYEEMG